jgi:hypothetical protein
MLGLFGLGLIVLLTGLQFGALIVAAVVGAIVCVWSWIVKQFKG